MAKIGEAISTIRTLLKEHTDDTKYTDQFIYHMLVSARSMLIERDYNKYKRLSDWYKQTYCIKLEEAVSHDCDCVSVGCKVLKSVFEIPKPLGLRGMDNINIYTLGYTSIDRVDIRYQKDSLLDDIKKDTIQYSILNNKVVVWNTLKLPAILVETIPEDPTDWEGITLCDSSTGEETDKTCFDPLQDQFPLDDDLLILAYEMVLNLILPSTRVKSDDTNDHNSEIKV